MTTPALTPITNPYVGPRTFTYEQRRFFFGREREARDLLARVVSERLVLFYAQSGAGKSSLLNTRLIPQLRLEEGFFVLPVGRVSGELPQGMAAVDNVSLFNLMASIDMSDADPARLTQISLSDFLARLVSEDGEHWVYDPTATVAPTATAAAGAAPQRYVLIIDQFEEIITSHPNRWHERAGFFRQLNEAMLADPNLWVVLTLREDYVAALDPYAQWMADKLRARFYMERMDINAALEAIRRPAELGGRPFAPGVAEALVDNLRRINVAGQEQEQLGQYVEPVQLQVVCYQLWERLQNRPPAPITADDLQQSGDVDSALAAFYEEAIANVLSQVDVAVSERQLRTWFDTKLITEAGTRGTVYQGQTETAGLPNPVVRLLANQFLLRTELRSGGAWVELVHDRFVEPITKSNHAWLLKNQNPLTQAAQAWRAAGQSVDHLYRERRLAEAAAQLEKNPDQFGDLEREFVRAGQQAEAQRKARRQRLLSAATLLAIAVLVGLTAWAIWNANRANVEATNARQAQTAADASRQEAERQANIAVTAQGKAEAEGQAAIVARAAAEGLRSEAESARMQAEQQRRIALANQLAAASVTSLELDKNSPRSILLAIEAISSTNDADQMRTPAAEEALRQALNTGVDPVKLDIPAGSVRAVSFSSNSEFLQVIITDSVLEHFKIDELIPRKTTTMSTTRGVESTELSPGGRWLMTIYMAQPITLQNIDSTEPQFLAIPSSGRPVRAAFSTNDRWLVTANNEGLLEVWNLSQAVDKPFATRRSGSLPTAIAISADGNWLAAASQSTFIRLWDLRTASEPTLFHGHEGEVLELTFSPDNLWLVSASADNTARMWQPDHPTVAALLLRNHQGFVTAAAFSPDHRLLFTGDGAGNVRIWNMQQKDAAPVRLRAHTSAVSTIRFSLDGQWFVTTGADGAVLRWRARLDDLITLACATAQRNLTAHEWRQYLVNISYRETCTNLPRPQIQLVYRNDQVVSAFLAAGREVNQNGWQLLIKVNLFDLLFHANEQYTGPDIQDLTSLTAQEREVILRNLLTSEVAVSPHALTSTLPLTTASNPPIADAITASTEVSETLTNQQVINIFAVAANALNRDLVELMDRAGLSVNSLAEQRAAIYSGPDIERLPNLTTAEQEAVNYQVRAELESSGEAAQGVDVAETPLTVQWSRTDLFSLPLQPPNSEQIVVSEDAGRQERMVANIWNKYGSLIAALSYQHNIDPNVAVAVSAIETAGFMTGQDGRIIIRFENHRFYEYWGKDHPEQFAQHFTFDPAITWQGHTWRPTPDEPFQEFHGSQQAEWEVFEFARSLDEEAALLSISMGSMQILGSDYSSIGYPSVDDMFAILSAPNLGAHADLFMLFDFIRTNNLAPALRSGDFLSFATAYNGTGQAQYYAELIERTSQAFQTLRSPAQHPEAQPTPSPQAQSGVQEDSPQQEASTTSQAPTRDDISLAKPFLGDFPISQRFGDNPQFYNALTCDGVALQGNPYLDFALLTGTVVQAADDGTVLTVSYEPDGLGHYVKLGHKWGESIYAHLEQIDVQVNQPVTRGDRLGLSGSTGSAAGSLLSFGIRVTPYSRTDGWCGYSDPLPYLDLTQQ